MQKHNITFPNALDDGNTIADKFKLVGHPMAFYISADGEILESRIGALDDEQLRKDFEKFFF